MLVSDESPAIRQISAAVIVRIGNDDAYAVIARGLQVANQDDTVKISILETLRSKPSFDSENVLNDLLVDGNPEIRARAAIALSERNQLESDQILVDAATIYDIPHYVWAKVVSRLEKSNNTKFDQQARPEPNHFRIDAHDKQRINAEILGWWTDKNSRKQK